MKNLCKYSLWVGGNFKHPITLCAKGSVLSLLLAACTTFTACSDDVSLLPAAGNQLQLSFGINAPQSRAIFTDTKLPDGSPVGVRLDGYADYANLVYTGTTSGSKQTWSSTTSVALTDTKGTLYAYWPQSSSVAIDAIDVDMTAADQTDWLYATPVADVNKNKASVAVTMNHAAANINVKVNKGSYKGAGAISNITLQSDGIALGGTFNAAQTTPGYTAFEDEGKPLSRTVSTTAGGTATDIMVVPSGKSAAITFLLTIDGIQFTAESDAVQLAMGNSYQYRLNLSDISTYMEISGFSVKQWTTVTGGALALDKVEGGEPLTWDNAPNGVYAMGIDGSLVCYDESDETCVGVVLIVNDAPVPQKLMIDKKQQSSYKWNYDYVDFPSVSYGTIDGVTSYGKLFETIDADYTKWTKGALSDFNGKTNTSTIYEKSSSGDMCYAVSNFNKTEGYYSRPDDWYIPSCGQLALIYLNYSEINKYLNKIRGTKLNGSEYWTSNQVSDGLAYNIIFNSGSIGYNGHKGGSYNVRFVRDVTGSENYVFSEIEFYIDSKKYYAQDGMMWEQWVWTEYNTYGYLLSGDWIMLGTGMGYIENIQISDKILNGSTYNITYLGEGGGYGGQ